MIQRSRSSVKTMRAALLAAVILGAWMASITVAQTPTAAGAGSPADDPDDPVVVRVETREIRRSEFERGWSHFEADSMLTEAENRRVYLGSAVDRLLLLAEAEVEGFFAQNPRIEQMVAEYEAYLIANEIREQEIRAKVSYTEEEVHDFYDRHAFLYEVSQIIVATEPEAQEAHRRALAGEDFAALAEELSVDSKSRRDGGRIKPFVWSATSLRFIRQIAALEPGEISEPIESDYGYHIIRLDALTPREQRPFAEDRELMEQQLAIRLQGEYQTDLYHALRERYDCETRLDVAIALASLYGDELDRAEAAEPEGDPDQWATVARSKIKIPDEMLFEPLLTWQLGDQPGSYTVQQNWNYMLQLPAAILLDRRNPHQILSDGYSEFHRMAMVYLGQERGYQDDPTIRSETAKKREEIVLTMFYQQKIIQVATFSEEDERRYYEENLDRFTIPTALRLAQIRYHDRAAAEEAERLFGVGGPELEAMVARHESAGVLETQSADTGWITEEVDPLLFERAGELAPGAVGRYIDTEGYWTVFLIRERQEGGTTSFADARETIQKDLRVIRSEEVLNDYLDALRAKHEIWIHPSEGSP